MDNLTLFERSLTSAVTVSAIVLLCVQPSPWSLGALTVAMAARLAASYIYRPIPEPPRTDEARFALLEHDLAETRKALDSLKTAVNMRQIR